MHNTFLRSLFLLIISVLCAGQASLAQINTSGGGIGAMRQQSVPQPEKPVSYYIGGITVSGTRFLDNDLLITVSGLSVGDEINVPFDEKVTRAIKNLWKQELFSDISIVATKYVGDKIFLEIQIEERPRLSKYNFKGIRKSEATELKDKVGLVKGKVVTEATKKEATVRINRYYAEKGFNDVAVSVKEYSDTVSVNSVILTFIIDKGARTRINNINIAGNDVVSDTRLKRTLKGTKEMARISFYPADDETVYHKDDRSFEEYMKNFHFLSPSKTLNALDPYLRLSIFSSSKFNQKKFEDDKQMLVAYYNTLGYRDAIIVNDTVYKVDGGNLNIGINIREGHKYYFGDIEWKGNTKYSGAYLSKVLGIKKGDVYNVELLETRLGKVLSPEGGNDVSSLYMNDGYLFFNVEPVEVSIVNDTINYEMRITEGPQATNKNIIIRGNHRTNEHVIRREIRTLPGNKFSRADLIRSQREIANLGFFDQEKIGIQPIPNQEDGTVDIEYSVVEKSSDQLQLSAGFGGGISFYGNIGVTFNNFSLRNVFKPKFWDPLPVGDGQRFSINYQSNGRFYNSMNVSFTEPWLGGKKPNALTTSFMYTKFNNSLTGTNTANESFMRVLGGGVSMSSRVKWPDDNFVFTYGVNFQNFKLKQYELISGTGFSDGPSNNLFFKLTLARYSIDQPLYPRSGSNLSFTFQFTPPYSNISGEDFSDATASEKYKWIEYHKYRFTAEWYQRIVGNMVFKFATKYGFMGYYNQDIGFAPFERFQVGGDGLSGQNFFVGRDIIAHRGYRGPYSNNATIFNKYTAEVRYPFSLSPTSTIYGLLFVEAANAWGNFSQFNPTKLNRSAGVGLRVFLPMFGLLGLDYGIGFDRYNRATGNTRLTDIANFTFMLGFEPD